LKTLERKNGQKQKLFPIVLGKTMRKVFEGFWIVFGALEIDYAAPFKVVGCKKYIKKNGQLSL